MIKIKSVQGWTGFKWGPVDGYCVTMVMNLIVP
jgi:hypothetical protein